MRRLNPDQRANRVVRLPGKRQAPGARSRFIRDFLTHSSVIHRDADSLQAIQRVPSRQHGLLKCGMSRLFAPCSKCLIFETNYVTENIDATGNRFDRRVLARPGARVDPSSGRRSRRCSGVGGGASLSSEMCFLPWSPWRGRESVSTPAVRYQHGR